MDFLRGGGQSRSAGYTALDGNDQQLMTRDEQVRVPPAVSCVSHKGRLFSFYRVAACLTTPALMVHVLLPSLLCVSSSMSAVLCASARHDNEPVGHFMAKSVDTLVQVAGAYRHVPVGTEI